MPPLIYQSNVGISLRHAVGLGGILRAADATVQAQTLDQAEAALEAALQQWITQPPVSLDAFGRSAPAKPLTPPYTPHVSPAPRPRVDL